MSDIHGTSDTGVPVLTERHGRVFVITLNRPEARNAVSPEMAQALEAAIDELERSDDLFVGILTGAGTVFCAGADLKAIAAGLISKLATPRGGFAGYVRRERTKPVIAALEGDAFAGGCEIAIACDMIVAAESVHLGIPETKRSLLASAGGLANLPRLVGEKLALEMAMTAGKIPAERLYNVGLISRIVPEGKAVPTAIELAEQICENAPLAVRASRKVIIEGRDLPEDDRWALGMSEMLPIFRSEDFQEGPRAFAEKRPPQWKGR